MSENLVPSEKKRRTDDDWTAHVLGLLTEGEKSNGNPRVDGLRRIIPKVLGNFVECYSRVVMPPDNGNEKRAVVEYHVVLDTFDGDEVRREHYAAAADAYKGNVSSPANKKIGFHEYPVAMAETRAAGRAFRHALALVGIIAAEEAAELGELDSFVKSQNTEIKPGQINGIKNLCEMLSIDLPKFINMGKGDYINLLDVPYDVAQEMMKVLNQYRDGKKEIPPEIKR